jgi:hypothetical protein
MENEKKSNKNLLLIGGAAALAVYYFFLRKPATTTTVNVNAPKVPTTTNVPMKTVVVSQSAGTNYVYPAGLSEGDYVKFGTAADVYLLHGGQKLPITEGWWNANAWDKWDTVKFLAPAVALDIPTGAVLS